MHSPRARIFAAATLLAACLGPVGPADASARLVAPAQIKPDVAAAPLTEKANSRSRFFFGYSYGYPSFYSTYPSYYYPRVYYAPRYYYPRSYRRVWYRW